MKKRFWEIDALRGIALIRIVIFNWSFTLMYLGIYTFSLGMALPGLGASIFIFLVGLSLTISYSRIRGKKLKETYKKYFSRGLKVFSYGLLISVITFLTFPESFVVFGILHFIGVSIILGQFFLKFKKLNLLLGLLLIIIGLYLQNFSFDFPWLLWLGFAPQHFYTFDYFPILPWFGITLLGIYFGNVLYKNGKRSFKIKDVSNSSIVRFLSFLGRKSLFIYLVHQPLLIIILLLLGFTVF
ncbi:MAG: heparan-alpha-glucosaminide N-acetyltransferase [Candidatus Aenigmatarchaeota archaeon]